MIEMRLVKRHRASGQDRAPDNALSLFNGGFAILECREVEDCIRLEPNSITRVSNWVQPALVKPASAEDFQLEESGAISEDAVAALRPGGFMYMVAAPNNRICFDSLVMTDHSADQVMITKMGAAQGNLVDKSIIEEWLLKAIDGVKRDIKPNDVT